MIEKHRQHYRDSHHHWHLHAMLLAAVPKGTEPGHGREKRKEEQKNESEKAGQGGERAVKKSVWRCAYSHYTLNACLSAQVVGALPS